MLAQTDPYIESAAESIYSSVTDPKILELCKKRQEEIRGDIRRRERLVELDKQISEKDQQISEKDQQISEKDQQISEKDQQISEKDDRISQLENILKSNGIEVPD